MDKAAKKSYDAAYYARNKERIKAQSKEYRKAHAEQIRAKVKRYTKERKTLDPEIVRDIRRKSYYKRREKLRAYFSQWYSKSRGEILEFLGGKCARCGFDDARALQIDHIYSDGAEERRKLGWNIYKRLDFIKQNRERLQLLCANCNQIKKIEKREHPKMGPAPDFNAIASWEFVKGRWQEIRREDGASQT